MPASQTAKAAIYAVLGMTLMGFIDNFVRLITSEIGLWQFHFTRSCLVLVVLLPLAVWLGWRLRPKRLWAVGLRSFFIASSMLLYFSALAVLPIAQAAAGVFTSPIFVLLLSALVFGVRIGPWRIFAVLIGFCGVLLMLRPDAGAFNWVTLVPVLAGLCYAFSAVSTKAFCEGESTAVLVAGFFSVIGVFGALGLVWFALSGQVTDPARDGFFASGWQSVAPQTLAVVAAQAWVSLLAIGMITRAYQMAEASHVAVFEYAFLISAGFWSYVLWGEAPDMPGLLGIALIIAAGVTIILRTRET